MTYPNVATSLRWTAAHNDGSLRHLSIRPPRPFGAPDRRHGAARVGHPMGPTLGVVEHTTRPLLCDVLPDFGAELIAGLTSIGREDLAQQVPSLRVWDRCGCDDSFCNSFYVGPEPLGAWRDEGDHENEMPEVDRGMVVLDVVSGTIRYVEALDRPEIRAALRAVTVQPPS